MPSKVADVKLTNQASKVIFPQQLQPLLAECVWDMAGSFLSPWLPIVLAIMKTGAANTTNVVN